MKTLLIKIVEYLFNKLTSGDALVGKAKNVSNTIDTVLVLITGAIDRLIARLHDIVAKLEDISATARQVAPVTEDRTTEIKAVINKISALKKKDAFKRTEVLEILDYAQAELKAAL